MIMKKIWIFVLPLLLAACSSKLDMVELTDWQFEYNGKWYLYRSHRSRLHPSELDGRR